MNLIFYGSAGVIALGLFLLLFRRLLARPYEGLYLAFFATAILITPYLPVVREKFGLTELVFLLTWLCMLANPAGWRNGAPLQGAQLDSIKIGTVFILAIVASFGWNNMGFYANFAGSFVETMNYIYGFLLFITVIRLVDSWQKWYGCLNGWFAGAVVLGIGAIMALTGLAGSWAYDEFTGRVSSTMKFENQIPAFLVPVIIAAMFFAVMRGIPGWLRRVYIGVIALIAITMISTGSRTAMGLLVLCMLGGCVIALFEGQRGAFFTSRFSVTMVSMIMAFIMYVAAALAAFDGHYALGHTPAWQRPVVMIYNTLTGQSGLDTTRSEQLDVVVERMDERMLFGAGPKLAGSRYYVSEIHNTYTSLLIETGFIGVGLFLLWLAHIFYVAFSCIGACGSARNRLIIICLLAGFTGVLAYGMTMYGLRQRNLWLLAGLLMAVPRLLAQDSQLITNNSNSPVGKSVSV